MEMSSAGNSTHMVARLDHLHEDIHLAQFIVRSLTKLENHMSDLTDKLDAALLTLDSEASDVASPVAANSAASDVLKGQLAAAQAGKAADEVELQKAIDALAAVNAKLQAAPPVAAPAPIVPAPLPVVATPPVDVLPVPVVPVDPAAPVAPAPAAPVV